MFIYKLIYIAIYKFYIYKLPIAIYNLEQKAIAAIIKLQDGLPKTHPVPFQLAFLHFRSQKIKTTISRLPCSWSAACSSMTVCWSMFTNGWGREKLIHSIGQSSWHDYSQATKMTSPNVELVGKDANNQQPASAYQYL